MRTITREEVSNARQAERDAVDAIVLIALLQVARARRAVVAALVLSTWALVTLLYAAML